MISEETSAGRFLTVVQFVTVDRQARMSGPELLEAVGNAERERAAAPDEVPLGEWEAVRVRPDCNAPLISQALLASAEEAKSLLQVGILILSWCLSRIYWCGKTPLILLTHIAEYVKCKSTIIEYQQASGIRGCKNILVK